MKKIIVILFCMFTVSIIVSQNAPKWENFTSIENANSVVADDDYIWVATYGGLIRVNKLTGEKTVFTKSNSGLPSNELNIVKIDTQGNLWVGTANQGLVKFDGENWFVFNTTNSELPHNNINNIKCYHNSTVICTNEGYVTIDSEGDWDVYTSNNSGLNDDNIKSAGNVGDDKFIGSASDGMYQYATSGDINHIPGAPSPTVTALNVGPSGNLWAGTYDGGIGRYDVKSGTWAEIYNTTNSDLPSDRITSINMPDDKKGQIQWIGTNEGLVKWDEANTSMTVYDMNNSPIVNNFVTEVFAEDDQNIWITTRGGSQHFDGSETWVLLDIAYTALPDESIQDIEGSENSNRYFYDQTIWICTDYSLVTYNGSEWFRYDSENSSMPEYWYKCLAIDQSGMKFLGTENNGMIVFNGTDWAEYNMQNSNIPGSRINDLIVDTENNIWVATWDGGVGVFDGTEWIVYNESNSELPENSVNCLFQDDDGRIWIGTYNGLAVLEGSLWTIYEIGNSGLTNDHIRSISCDQNGIYWIGTYDNLAGFNGSDWTIYDESNTGLDLRIRDILFDNYDQQWMATITEGLVMYDGDNWTSFNISNSALSENDITCLYIDNINNIWSGSMYTGITVYNEDGIVLDNSELPVESFYGLLQQNYPNPVSGVTQISFLLNNSMDIRLVLYDINGKLIKILDEGMRQQGNYYVNVDVQDLQDGIYFYCLETKFDRIAKKMIIAQ